MKTTCPHCGSCFEVDEAYLNQQTDCPSCGKFFLISPENKPKPVLKPIADRSGTPSGPAESPKKDVLLFWIAFPVFYFLALMVLSSPATRTWSGVALCTVWLIALDFAAQSVIMAETGMKRGKELAMYSILLFFVFPVGFLMYADLRRKCGLSNIMPWAVTTSIAIGLFLFVLIGMAVS